MRYIGIIIIIFSNLLNGLSQSKANVIHLLIYHDFIKPAEIYKSLRHDIIFTNYVDSIKIIGCPVKVPVIDVEIDTARAILFGFNIKEISNQISDSLKYLSNKDDIMNKKIGYDTLLMPISNIASFHYKLGYQEPDVFLPQPDIYYYNNKRAVRLDLYYKTDDKKKLIQYIRENIDNYLKIDRMSYFYSSGKEKVEYEIIEEKFKDN